MSGAAPRRTSPRVTARHGRRHAAPPLAPRALPGPASPAAAPAGPVLLAPGLWLVAGPGLTGDHDALGYLLDCGGGRAVLVDCGMHAAPLLGHVAAAGFAPAAVQAVLATHGHLDHLGAAPGLLAAGTGGVWLHRAEAAAARAGDPVRTAAHLYGGRARPLPVTRELAGEERLAVGDRTIHAIHVPGHSPGSTAFVVEAGGRRIALLGDALWGGYHPRLGSDLAAWEATLERLEALDCDALSFGHGPPRLVGPYRAKVAYARRRFGFLLDPWRPPPGGADAWVPERPGFPGAAG